LQGRRSRLNTKIHVYFVITLLKFTWTRWSDVFAVVLNLIRLLKPKFFTPYTQRFPGNSARVGAEAINSILNLLNLLGSYIW